MKLFPRLRLAAFSALTAAGFSLVSVVASGVDHAETATISMMEPAAGPVSDTLGLGAAEDVSITGAPVAPLTSTLQPVTPWPVETSGTTVIPYNLLAYSGVDEAAKTLVGKDYEMWKTHFAAQDSIAIPAVVTGFHVLNGCLKSNCDMHKSLLVVDAFDHKVYAAMVTEGKVAMWPSLMSWPDEAIPALKTWLADATDGSFDK